MAPMVPLRVAPHLSNVSVTNNNTTDGIEVDSGATLTLTDDVVDGGTITVEDGATLTLIGTQITDYAIVNVDLGGTLNLFDSSIDTQQSTFLGLVTVESGKVVYLTNELVLGGIIVDATGALNLAGNDTINNDKIYNGALNNAGYIYVSDAGGIGNTIEHADGDNGPGATIGLGTNIITNTGFIAVGATTTSATSPTPATTTTGTLTLSDDWVANSGGTITVTGQGTLNLAGDALADDLVPGRRSTVAAMAG